MLVYPKFKDLCFKGFKYSHFLNQRIIWLSLTLGQKRGLEKKWWYDILWKLLAMTFLSFPLLVVNVLGTSDCHNFKENQFLQGLNIKVLMTEVYFAISKISKYLSIPDPVEFLQPLQKADYIDTWSLGDYSLCMRSCCIR